MFIDFILEVFIYKYQHIQAIEPVSYEDAADNTDLWVVPHPC